jgi:plasmid stability protein
MAAITISDIPEETDRALRERAASNGRSAQAELLHILEEALSGQHRLKIGTELAAFGKAAGGLDLDIQRDFAPVQPARFE